MINTKLSLITLLAGATAAPTIAAADHGRQVSRWIRLGEVGTHAHDAEDYVPVTASGRFASIELRATGQAVGVDQVRVQFADGRKFNADVNRVILPGERIVLDIPAYSPIKMLVLDYDNQAPFWRAREDARVTVRGLTVAPRLREDRYRRDDRYRREIDIRDRRTQDVRFEWRGGIYIRI